MTVVRAEKFDWRPDEGVLIVSGRNGENPIAIPINGLQLLANQARQFMAAAPVRAQREAGGDWLKLSPVTVQTCRVQTIETVSGPRCLLLLDPGTATEFPVSFQTPELARQVGEALIAVADAMPTNPQNRN